LISLVVTGGPCRPEDLVAAQPPARHGSSIRGRPPGPRGAGRDGIRGSISSQSRSSTRRCCVVFATTAHDRRPGPAGYAV